MVNILIVYVFGLTNKTAQPEHEVHRYQVCPASPRTPQSELECKDLGERFSYFVR